jgi:hypothetical protein
MSKKDEILTILELYQTLSKNEKTLLRDSFLNKFQYGYSSWYQKIKEDRFKIVEREFLMQELEKATNTDIN